MDKKLHKNKSSDRRRKLLKSIVAGSGAVIVGKSFPEKWSRPMVDSVMLPAHAVTTTMEPCCVDFCDLITNNENVEVFSASFCEGMVSIAGGGAGPGAWEGSGPVAENGDYSFQVDAGISEVGTIAGNVTCTTLTGTFFGPEITFTGTAECT